MFGRATFTLGGRTVLAIPAASVSERGQLQSVTVVESGTPHTRLITTGEKRGDRLEVLSGLSASEKVAVQGGKEQ
jgi:hypothetical protein